MIHTSHRIGDFGQWIMDIVEKSVSDFIFLIVLKPKDSWMFEGKYSKQCDDVIILHFDFGFSYIFRLLLNLIGALIYT